MRSDTTPECLCTGRCFVWGAKSGEEMLPGLPEPVHQSAFSCPLPIQAQLGRVSFRTQQAYDEALPPVRACPWIKVVLGHLCQHWGQQSDRCCKGSQQSALRQLGQRILPCNTAKANHKLQYI